MAKAVGGHGRPDRESTLKISAAQGLMARRVTVMFWYHDMGWWGFAGMGIGIVLFWALLILGIVALVTVLTSDQQPRRSSPPEPPSAEQIPAARFAGGEISETEYRDRLTVLRDAARQ